MGRTIESSEKENKETEVISKLKEAIERYLDSRSSDLGEESEIYVSKYSDDTSILLEVTIPRMSLDKFRELDVDIQNFIDEYASDNSLEIKALVNLSNDYAQALDDLEFGEEININDASDYDEDDSNYYDEFRDNNMNIYSEDDLLKSDGYDYYDDSEDFDDEDEDEDDYKPDAKDLVDFFSTDNYNRLNDNDIRRSMGAYDDY